MPPHKFLFELEFYEDEAEPNEVLRKLHYLLSLTAYPFYSVSVMNHFIPEIYHSFRLMVDFIIGMDVSIVGAGMKTNLRPF